MRLREFFDHAPTLESGCRSLAVSPFTVTHAYDADFGASNGWPVLVTSAQMVSEPQKAAGRKWRVVLRRLLYVLAGMALLLVAALLFWLRGALYDRFLRFPREEAAWVALRSHRQTPIDYSGWREYRGILHAHSRLSHDCEVPFEDILRALKIDGLDFICLSDHCVNGQADFSAQWRGLHDGKLFIPGFEMKEGIMPFGVTSGVVLSNATDSALLARQIAEHGGLLFYAHPEEPRAWDRPELTGMEIYNIHSDFKASGNGFGRLLPDLLVNQSRYPEHVFRLLFRRPTPFLKRWDELNRTRHIVGIAGNDCHQNTGIRASVTTTNTLWIEDTSPRKLINLRLNWLTRPLARLALGRLTPGRMAFHTQLDPYERMARFVNTHVLARELTEAAILDSLREGRAFIGFDMVADSAGFRWMAKSATERAFFGEKLHWTPDTRLQAMSPLPCRFTMVKDGSPVWQESGRALNWTPPGPGKYRVEAELNVLGKWLPWVYANPIELH